MDHTLNIFSREYDIIRKIGEGGTAEAFLAHRSGHAEAVVLKLFQDQAAKELVEREWDLSQKINFPGIMKIYRAGKTLDDNCFLELEYCSGSTLEKLVGKISEEKLLSLLSAAAASLSILHRSGYSHNDLKPSNIFCPVGFENDNFRLDSLYYLKLADFSLARPLGGIAEETVTGTVGYMSPEMILKKDIAPASDLFSLGVTAYYLACGKLPFTSAANDPLEVNAKITEGDRPALEGPASSFSKGLAGLIGNLLSIDPKNRPASADELMEILARLGSPYPFRKAIRPRHLLWGLVDLNAEILTQVFGKDSFSAKHLQVIDKTTGYDPCTLRILLEHNFDAGNFVRLDGHWGWTKETADVIEWSDRQIRFALYPLRGRSLSFMKLALAAALAEDANHVEKIVGTLFPENSVALLEQWQQIPSKRILSLLFSLMRVMRPSTKKILSARLVPLFENAEEHKGLTGKLLFNAGQYERAFPYLSTAAEKCATAYQHDDAFDLLSLALKAAEATSDDEKQVDILFRTASLYDDRGELAEAEDKYNEAVHLAAEKGRKSSMALIYMSMGDLYKKKSDYNSGICVLQQALQLYEELHDQLGLMKTLNNLGLIYWVSGQLDLALDCFYKALEIGKQLSEDKGIGRILGNIGMLHVAKGEYEKAISFLTQALNILKEPEDRPQLVWTWNNLGLAYFSIGKTSAAIDAYSRCLGLCQQLNWPMEETISVHNLAEAMIQAGSLNEGIKHLTEGSTLACKLENKWVESGLAELTGRLLSRMGHYNEAEIQLKKSLEIAHKLENPSLKIPCYLGFARLSLAIGEDNIVQENIRLGLEAASGMGDKQALFHLSLLQFALIGDEQSRHDAEKYLAELKTPREKALLNLTLLEKSNRKKKTDQSDEYLLAAGEFFFDENEDIDRARFELAAGRYYLLCQLPDRAIERGEKALQLASGIGLLPEQWQAAALLSEALFVKEDFEASYKYARQATDILKRISLHLENRKRLEQFYNDIRIVALLERIKSLQAVLSKTKKTNPQTF